MFAGGVMNHSLKILGSSSHTEEDREKNDYYATDPEALKDLLRTLERDGVELHRLIWEPSCGEGNLSKVLQEKGFCVLSTDLVNREFGSQRDFLKPSSIRWDGDILTNPPYKVAEEFIRTALARTRSGKRVIMLLRLQFLEGIKRSRLYDEYPPKYVYVHSKRIKIWKNNEKGGSNAVAYAWYIWEKGFQGEPSLRWIKKEG
jgi:hypothetical protein